MANSSEMKSVAADVPHQASLCVVDWLSSVPAQTPFVLLHFDRSTEQSASHPFVQYLMGPFHLIAAKGTQRSMHHASSKPWQDQDSRDTREHCGICLIRTEPRHALYCLVLPDLILSHSYL